jgi:autotransporter-associated beta strand protein
MKNRRCCFRWSLVGGLWCAWAAAASAQSWTPVPAADFSTIQLSQFADHELDVPYHLNHFAQVANSVVENTTTIDGVTYPRGFLNIKVNREPKDNMPYNARILEMQMALAFFYTADRPWNPYRGSVPVRQRLEAMMNLWTTMQAPEGHPSAGLFTEYSASNWSMAPTSFGVMAAAQAVDMILASGLPFDEAILDNAKTTIRRALMALFTREDMRRHARQWSNQFNGAYHAALIYLERWPDAQLDAAFVQAVKDSSAQDQSPAGFWYEQDGPDFGYSAVHDNNLRVAWPRLRQRTDLTNYILGDDIKWNDWLGANMVLQPGRPTNTFFTSAGLNTRTSHAFQTPRSRPLAEFATNSRAFALTDTEFAASMTAKRGSEQSRFGNYGNLSVPNGFSYIPTFVYDASRPAASILNGWHPTAAQRDAAIAALPSRSTNSFNRLFHNAAPTSGAFSLGAVKRGNYYATFASGNRRLARQAYGLNLLWNPSFGLALQPVSGSSTSVPWQWGTVRGTNAALAYETGNIPGTIKAGSTTVAPAAGVTDLPSGDYSVSYALTSGGTNFGQKSVTLGGSNVSVVVTHSNVFTEYLPLAYASDATLNTNSASRLVLQRPNGSSFLLQLNSPASIDAGNTSSFAGGMVRRGVTIRATNTLSYTLTVSETAPPAETTTPSLSIADVAVSQPVSGSTEAVLTVTLSVSPSSTVTVNYATENGTALAGADYTATSGTLAFTSGQTSKTITVPVAAGSLPQGSSKNFGVKLTEPVNATVSRGTATVTINGSTTAPPSVAVADASANQPPAGAAATNMTFNVSLSSAASGPVTLGYATQDSETGFSGVHYVETSGILQFAAGQTNRTVTVPILPGSLEVGQSVDFFLRLSDVSGATVADDTARGVINGSTPPPPPPAGSVRIEFVFQNAWGPPSTYQGTFRIINNSTANILDWRADFDSDVANRNRFTVFNGSIADATNAPGRYTFVPVSWQANLGGGGDNAGKTFDNLGFQAQPNGDEYYPRNIKLRVLQAGNVNALGVLTPANLGSFGKGSPFLRALEAGGGIGPYVWSLAGNSVLPAGLTMTSDGVISGTLTTSGGNSFAVDVTDLMGSTTSRTFSLTVSAPPLAIETAAIFSGATAGQAFSQQLVATGGLELYSWSVVAGALPPGLTLGGSGLLAGTPSQSGAYAFTVLLADGTEAVTREYAMDVAAAPELTVATAALPAAVAGAFYTQALHAAGGEGPYTWALISGALPAGLSLAGDGTISGTTPEVGAFGFTVRVTDAAADTATRELSLSVTDSLEILTAELPGGTAGSAYSQTLAAQGGTSPYAWSVTAGALPSGLTLSPSGDLTGTPAAGGNFSFTVRVREAGGVSAERELSLFIQQPLSLDTVSLPSIVTGVAYARQLSASGGMVPYEWSVAGGSLPAGLALSADGAIAGTPSAAGTSTFTVRVTDGAASSAERQFTIVVSSAVSLTWDADPAAAGQQNGAGIWSTAGANWLASGTNTAWVEGYHAVFGGGTGAGATITLDGDRTVGNLTFNTTTNGGTYTLTGPGRSLTLKTDSVITANTEASINVRLLGTNFTKAGTGRLILNNAAYEGDVGVTGELRLVETDNRTWAGTISGGGNVTKYGSGTLTLAASNPITGFFTVTEGGALRVRHDHALGTTNNNTTIQGGTNFASVILDGHGLDVGETFQLVMHNQNNAPHFQLRNAGGTNTVTGNLLLNSGGARWDIGSESGHIRFHGAVSNIANVSIADTWRVLYLTGPGSGEFNGTMQDTTNGLSKLNVTVVSGDWTLGGSNKSYTGNTVVSNGILRVETGIASVIDVKSSGTLSGSGSTTTNLVLQSGATFAVTLSDWRVAPPAFTAHRLVAATDNTNWTIRLDAAAAGGFEETDRTMPVLRSTLAWSNIDTGAITLDTTGFPGRGSWTLDAADQTLSLVYTAPVDPFDNWKDSIPWNGADSSPEADPDGDGIVNLAEYALGLDPLSASTWPPGFISSVDDTERLAVTFQRVADPGLVYEVMASGDLDTWTPVWSSTGAANTAGPVTVHDSEPLRDHRARFMRLKITR